MTAKEEKTGRFVKVYLDTSDRIEAAKAVSRSRDPHNLRKLAAVYLDMPEVQDAVDQANTFVLDRDGIARALTEILTGKNTVDQKIKASNALEKLTRYGDDNTADVFQEDFERFLCDYGDVLDEFMNGNGDKFEETFRPRLGKDGKVEFHVKKNNGCSAQRRHQINKERMIILLQALISRNAFS